MIHADPRRGRNTAHYCDVLVPAEAIRDRWPSRSMPGLALPELMKPEGPATCHSTARHNGSQLKVGRSASTLPMKTSGNQPTKQLLARIASEEIKVVGTRNGERQPVPGYHFAGSE